MSYKVDVNAVPYPYRIEYSGMPRNDAAFLSRPEYNYQYTDGGGDCAARHGNCIYAGWYVCALVPAATMVGMSLAQYMFGENDPPYSDRTMVVMYAVCGSLEATICGLGAWAIGCCGLSRRRL